MELGKVGWGEPDQGGAEVGVSQNNLELDVVTEQPRKSDDHELEEKEQESSLESQPGSESLEDRSSIEAGSSATAFGFEKSFLKLKKAATGESQVGGDEEDGHSLDSGFQESRLQELEAHVKRSSQLSRTGADVDQQETSSLTAADESLTVRSDSEKSEPKSEERSNQSSKLNNSSELSHHVLWSKGSSSDSDDEGEKKETSRESETDVVSEKKGILQNEELKKEGKEDDSNSKMEKAEMCISKVG